MSLDPLTRWRLMLGAAADGPLPPLTGATCAMDDALAWLYDRDPELGGRDVRGDGPSLLTVPAWIEQVQRLFPKETIERLERDAVERFQIDELVTNAEVLQRVAPSQAMLEAVLRTKHLMNDRVRAMARELVRRVVARLMEALAIEVTRAATGPRRRRPNPASGVLDLRATLRANLGRWSPERRRLYLDRPRFVARSRRQLRPWQVILLVDQSGSMLGSVIHSAVTAACLWSMPGVRPHLLTFDTQVVDLTPHVTDPVDLLMGVQLGGGTDIARALRYARELIEAPHQAIVVLISDFGENGPAALMVAEVAAMVAQRTRVLALAALDPEASPCFDAVNAELLAQAGAKVAALTPGELVGWIVEQVRA
jgi:Mg-chelatase subunit ChlD